MYAEIIAGAWVVVDPAGGIWWPNASATAEIEEAEDGAAEVAVKICNTEPTRGAWEQ